MKAVFRTFQIIAIAIAIFSLVAVLIHRSLFPILFAIGAWVVYSSAAVEIKEIESK